MYFLQLPCLFLRLGNPIPISLCLHHQLSHLWGLFCYSFCLRVSSLTMVVSWHHPCLVSRLTHIFNFSSCLRMVKTVASLNTSQLLSSAKSTVPFSKEALCFSSAFLHQPSQCNCSGIFVSLTYPYLFSSGILFLHLPLFPFVSQKSQFIPHSGTSQDLSWRAIISQKTCFIPWLL